MTGDSCTIDFLADLARPSNAAVAAKSTISSETVFSPFAEDVDRENKDSFTRLAGRDVASESESLVELEVALELELGELDDEEYRLDFDLRFFEPFVCFWAGFFAAFACLRFFPA